MRASALYRVVAILGLTTIAAWSLAPAIAGERGCLGGMKGALVKGHFTGPIVCSSDADFALVGKTTGATTFSIYDYRYRYMPPDGNVMHGGQRLLVFRGAEYLGQYSMSPPPYTKVAVKGSRVVLSKEGTDSATVDFSMGPPPSIYFDGDTEAFFR